MGWFRDLLDPFGTKHPLDNPGGFLVGKYLKKKGQNQNDSRLTSLQVNQSAYGIAVALVYGKTRVPINLLQYEGFTATAHTTEQSGGKGGSSGASKSTSYTYSAGVVMLLSEGQISSAPKYWVDKEQHTNLADLGLSLFTGAGGQSAWGYLTTNFPTRAIPYDHESYLAGVIDLPSGAIPNITVEIKALQTNATYNDDAVPAAVLADYCTDANHGAGFAFLDTLTGAGNTYETYCIAMGFFISPQEMTQRPAVEFIREVLQVTNSQAVWSPGLLRIVPYADAAVTGNSKTYTPDLTPLYSFGDSDFLYEKGQMPVRTGRVPGARIFNRVRVEFLDRARSYNTNIAEATDQNDITNRGDRAMPTVTLHMITEMATARLVAQLILQRQLYIRNNFEFKVRADYSLLEPMDLVAITDSTQGIVNQLVRITDTDDSEDDEFTITAEEMLVGTAGAPRYDTQAAAGYAANYNVAPSSVQTPLIFTAPPLLVDVNGGYEIWIAVAGTTHGTWGGCDVFMSLDNTTFGYVGTINGPARYGSLSATFASGVDPDTTNLLAVTLADTTLQLVGGTATDADNLTTLLWVDGEVCAYRYVTLTGTGAYGFSSTGAGGGTKYMRRGKYGTAIASHSSATKFARIDGAIFRMPFDPGMVGKTVYFKFPSFNVYGHAQEDISGLSSYSIALTGANYGQSLPGNSTFVARGNCVVVGDKFYKSGGSSAWDSDVRSIEAFSAGCVLRFRAGQVNADVGMGLNSDPLTDQNYTSVDHWINCSNVGTAFIYENGGGGYSIGAYTVNTVFSITYDGITVRYYMDGVLVREVQNPGKVFFVDSSFYTPGGAVVDAFFGALNSSPTQRLIARGNCVVIGNSIQKVGGSSAWDSDCYSNEQFVGGCSVSWRRGSEQLADGYMIGLNSDPTTDQNYTSLDYAIECYYSSGYKVFLFESGSGIGSAISSSAGAVLSIKYDGQWVRYYQDGVLLREKFDPGKTLFMDSSFDTPGSIALDVNFGPLVAVTPSPYIARGFAKISDSNVIKQGGASARDSDFYSIVGYPVCHVSFKSNGWLTTDIVLGLSTDPTSSISYTNINYSFDAYGTGDITNWAILESGSTVGVSGTATKSTVFAITYDGTGISYWVDGVAVRSVSVSGLTLFAKGSFTYPSEGINSLRFGPTVNLAVADTPQIGLGAATITYAAADAGPDTYNSGTVPSFYLHIDGDSVPSGSIVRATLTTTAHVAVGGTLGQMNMILDWGAGSQAADIIDVANTSDAVFTIQRDFPALPVGVAWTLEVKVFASGSASVTFKNTRVLVEVIKR